VSRGLASTRDHDHRAAGRGPLSGQGCCAPLAPPPPTTPPSAAAWRSHRDAGRHARRARRLAGCAPAEPGGEGRRRRRDRTRQTELFGGEMVPQRDRSSRRQVTPGRWAAARAPATPNALRDMAQRRAGYGTCPPGRGSLRWHMLSGRQPLAARRYRSLGRPSQLQGGGWGGGLVTRTGTLVRRRSVSCTDGIIGLRIPRMVPAPTGLV